MRPPECRDDEYDAAISYLTNHLVFMSEHAKLVRYNFEYIVSNFLFISFVLVYTLKKEIWKSG